MAWEVQTDSGLALSRCLQIIQSLQRRFPDVPALPHYMVGTRRKSKAAAATASALHDHDGTSTQSIDDHPPPFNVPIPIDVDIDELSSLIPEVSFTNPTPETIVAVYRLLLVQVAETNATQRDLEESRADVERKEVELDQAYQDAENKSKTLESSLEDVQNQLIATRQEKEQLGASSITTIH